MILACLSALLAMSSADAVVTLLNSSSACGAQVFAEAKTIVAREAAAGKPLQQFVFGLTSPDDPQAKRYLDASRERIQALAEGKNNPLAWYLLSVERNDYTLLQKAAAGNNVQALNALGSIAISEAFNHRTFAQNTNHLESVLRRGFDCFRRAAAQRDPNGFINLGTCYLRGFGCEQNMPRAVACFKFAAEAGHPEGMENLSAAFQFGHGVPMDEERSLYWAMRARAVRGDQAAEKWLKERK